MRAKSIILSTLATLSIASPAFCETPDMTAAANITGLEKGVVAYNHKHYSEAVAAFELAAKNGGNKDAVLHYYLANAYLQLGKSKEALAEYRTAYFLSPKGPIAQFASTAIIRLNAPAARKKTVAAKAAETLPLPEVTVNVAGLPPVPSTETVRPTLNEIKQWTDQLRAGYLNDAESRVPQAEERAYNAQQLLSRAQDACSAVIPSKPKRGEDLVTFKRRHDAVVAKLREILRPYEEYATASKQEVADSKTIFSTCQASEKVWMASR